MNTNLKSLYSQVNNPFVIILRGVLILVVLTLIILLRNTPARDEVLSLFLLLTLNEAFIHFKINRQQPARSALNADDSQDALELKTAYLLNHANNTKQFVSHISKNPAEKFILSKIGVAKIEVLDVPKEELLNKSLSITRSLKSDTVTAIELFAAYLSITEEKTHLLRDNSLTTDDLLYLAYWARKQFPPEKNKKQILFSGTGAFDFFVYGWDQETRKYALDFTSQSIGWGASAHALGRSEEFDLLVKSLSKSKNNNALLIGEEGVGKTSLVAFFAKESYGNRLPKSVSRKRVYTLLLDRLLAGASERGEIEKRLTLLLSEVSHAGNAIIFIPNIEIIFGNNAENLDISQSLNSYLESGSVRIIGTTTPANYQSIIRPNTSTSAQFQKIELKEPNHKEALGMILEPAMHLESVYSVSIEYSALKESISLAASYGTDLALPGSAMILLEDSIQDIQLEKRKILKVSDVQKKVEQKTSIPLLDPAGNEKQKLLTLEDELHAKVIGQDHAITAIANALRRTRSGFTEENKPIATFLFLGPTGVGKTQTAKALAESYFGGVQNIIRLDMTEYSTPDSVKKLLGEAEYTDSLIERVRRNPYSLILLDEFEKSNPHIQDTFLQVFDDARLTSNKGETVSFQNSIIIATSNAGSEYIRENIQDPYLGQNLQERLLKSRQFKPELLNRFTEIIVFTPLAQSDVEKIAQIELKNSLATLKDEGYFITADNKVIQRVANDAYSQEYGARQIKRYIEKYIESQIAKNILEESIPKNTEITLTLDDRGQFILQ